MKPYNGSMAALLSICYFSREQYHYRCRGEGSRLSREEEELSDKGS